MGFGSSTTTGNRSRLHIRRGAPGSMFRLRTQSGCTMQQIPSRRYVIVPFLFLSRNFLDPTRYIFRSFFPDRLPRAQKKNGFKQWNGHLAILLKWGNDGKARTKADIDMMTSGVPAETDTCHKPHGPNPYRTEGMCVPCCVWKEKFGNEGCIVISGESYFKECVAPPGAEDDVSYSFEDF